MSTNRKVCREAKFWEPGTEHQKKWNELMNRGDTVGIRYLEAARLKRKRKPAKTERRFLAEFEADRKRIASDPESVWKEALEKISRGRLLLETLVHEKKEQGLAEQEDEHYYNAVCSLSSMAAMFRDDIIRYAEDGHHFACHAVFRDGKALASAFARIATAYPGQIREYAERSLTMPSLRARSPNFTCDADAIMAAIHLAEKHHASGIHDNRSRIGALCHQFIAERVDLIEAARLEAVQSGHDKPRYLSLPELRGNAREWWRLEVKELVNREYKRMKDIPYRNPALWRELEKVTDGGSDAAKRAAFEKYCFNKLEQIAGKSADGK